MNKLSTIISKKNTILMILSVILQTLSAIFFFAAAFSIIKDIKYQIRQMLIQELSQ